MILFGYMVDLVELVPDEPATDVLVNKLEGKPYIEFADGVAMISASMPYVDPPRKGAEWVTSELVLTNWVQSAKLVHDDGWRISSQIFHDFGTDLEEAHEYACECAARAFPVDTPPRDLP